MFQHKQTINHCTALTRLIRPFYIRHPNSSWLTKAAAYSVFPGVNFDLRVSDDDVISKANRFRPVMPLWGPSSQRSVIHVDLPLHRHSDNMILSRPLISFSCHISFFMTHHYIYTQHYYIYIHASFTFFFFVKIQEKKINDSLLPCSVSGNIFISYSWSPQTSPF